MENRKTLPQIVFLRAIASLSVCLFHLYVGNTLLFPDTNALKPVFHYGWLGVPVFFVISGFIISYSLPKTYQLSDFKTFILKRVIRIDPPYVVSIILTIFLLIISAPLNHLPFHFSAPNFLYHLGYLNNFKLGEYYNPVYWTLGIEFQFYVLLGLGFWIMRRSQPTVVGGLLVLLASSFITISNYELVFSYLPVFCLGIATYFFQYTGNLKRAAYWAILILSCFLVYYRTGLPMLYATLFALAMVWFWKADNKLIRFFSRISYSLYLTHVPIGGRIVNLGLRFAHTTIQRYELFFLALGISIFFAYLFEKFIEKPFYKWAHAIKYEPSHGKRESRVDRARQYGHPDGPQSSPRGI